MKKKEGIDMKIICCLFFIYLFYVDTIQEQQTHGFFFNNKANAFVSVTITSSYMNLIGMTIHRKQKYCSSDRIIRGSDCCLLRRPLLSSSSSIIHNYNNKTDDNNDKVITSNDIYDDIVNNTAIKTAKLPSFRRLGGRNRKMKSNNDDNNKRQFTSTTFVSSGRNKKEIKRNMKRIIHTRINNIKNVINEKWNIEKRIIGDNNNTKNLKDKKKSKRRRRRKNFVLAAIGLAIVYQLLFGINNNNNNNYYYYQSSSYIERRIYTSSDNGEPSSEIIQRKERFDSNIPGLNDRMRIIQQQQNNINQQTSPSIIQMYENY